MGAATNMYVRPFLGRKNGRDVDRGYRRYAPQPPANFWQPFGLRGRDATKQRAGLPISGEGHRCRLTAIWPELMGSQFHNS